MMLKNYVNTFSPNALGKDEVENKTNFFKTTVLLLFALLGWNTIWGQATNGFLDFGTPTNGTTATTANTGFGGVRVGSGGGGFTIQNPGQSIGTGGEIRGIAPTTASINSVGITSAEYGTAASTFTISFELHLSGGSSGIWYFFAGNGTSFGSAQSSAFSGADVFTGLRWTFGASNAITTDNRSAGSWATVTGTPFAQNTAYYVTIVGNNTASTVNYGASSAYSVATGTYDLWINGTLVGNDLAKAQLASATNINAFRFYGESSTSNVATIALDNVRWYNSCVIPPTHLKMVSVPTTGIVGSNLSSYTVEAHSGSATGPVANSFTGAITVAKASGTGSISGTLAPSASAGIATYSDTKFDTAGTFTISATAASPIVASSASPDIVISAASSPVLAITGTPTNHGAVCPGTAATTIQYTITNSAAVQADGISVVSSDPQFVVSGLSSTSIAASGGTATYNVTFTPSSAGSKSATITVTSTTSGSNSPTSSLTGTGTTPVSQSVSSAAATSVANNSATLNGNVTALGVCPSTSEKGFVYSATATNADPLNGGTGVTKTTVAGLATGAYTLGISSLSPGTGYTFKAYVYDGTSYTYGSATTFTTSASAPTLTAAGAATVDAPFDVTFTDDISWRGAITSITVGGTTLTAGYTVNAGSITFTPSASNPAGLLQSSGTKTIAVNATGYAASTVSQTIGFGTATKLVMGTQPTAPSTNGGALAAQPVVIIADQYGNTTASTASVSAAATQGTWTLGGTATLNGVNGTATFSGLTATSASAVTGASITFTSGSLTSVTSSGFNIPAPAPANDLCSNATTMSVGGSVTNGTMVNSTNDPTWTTTALGDVWYKFTPTCTGTVSFTTNSNSMNIGVYSWATSCPTDNSGYTNIGTANSLNPTGTLSVTAGTTYYIRVAYFSGTATTFTITATNNVTPQFTLANTGTPATGVITAGTTASLFGFALTPSACTSSFDLTAASITTTGTATSSDLSNFRLIVDANANGVADAGEISAPIATVSTLSGTLSFSSITGQTGITAVRRYLLIADVNSSATALRTFSASLSSANTTSSVTVSGSAAGNTQTINRTAPILTAAVAATVDAPFDVTFTEDAAWRAAITSITIGGTTLTSGYSTSASGKITFTPSASVPTNLLQVSGAKTILVNASGYTQASVSQTIGVGVATKLTINTQPTAPATNGAVLAVQPKVNVTDQYGNVTASTASITAAASQGTWTLGGTNSVNAVSGVATFSGLTASSDAAVTGATIAFSATGLTGITSGTFNIPAPDYLILSSLGTSVSQNFDTMGTNLVTPQGFSIQTGTGSTLVTDINFQASSGSPTSGGSYNWGQSSSERALGFMYSGSYSDRSIVVKIKNTTSSSIETFTLSFDYEQYRRNTSTQIFKLQYSTSLTSGWTDVTGGSFTNIATGNSTYGYGTLIASQSISNLNFSPSSAVSPGSTVYFRWILDGSSSSAGVGIDNFSISGCPTLTASVNNNSPICSGNNAVFTLNGSSGATVTYKINGGSDQSATLTGGSATVTVTGVTSNTTLTLVSVSSGLCSQSLSGTSTVDVNSTSVGGSISGGTTVCSGTNSTTLILNGYTGSVTKWQSSSDSNFSSNVSDITNTTNSLTVTNLTATTYYRAVVTSGVCSSANSATATVTVNPVSVGGSVSGGTTVCSGTNSTTLTLNGYTGSVTKWQSSSDSNFSSNVSDITNTTNSLTVTNLTATTYYRAVVVSGVCSAANSGIATVTVNENVTYYADGDGDGYGDSSRPLTSCTGTPDGYVTNNTDCDDANKLVNPNAVEICGNGIDDDCDGFTDEDCGLPIPTTSLISARCNSSSVSPSQWVDAQSISGATGYKFNIYTSTGVFITAIERSTYFFRFSQMNFTYGATYQVGVKVKQGEVYGAEGSRCNITLSQLPTTTLVSAMCNSSSVSPWNWLFANAVTGATGYRFNIYEGANLVTSIDRTVPYFRFQGNTFAYGATYQVRIQVKQNGVYGAEGDSCIVTIQSMPTIKLQDAYCGISDVSPYQWLFVNDVAGATAYKYNVYDATGTNLVFSTERSVTYFRFLENTFTYGATYQVRVQVKQGDSYGVEGSACSVTIQGLPTTSLATSSCGANNVTPYQWLFVNAVAGATAYKYNVYDATGTNLVFSTERSVTYFRFLENTFTYGATYQVRVQVKQGDSYGVEGSACSVTIQGLPTTSLATSSCGANNVTPYQWLFVNAVAGATAYKYNVYDATGTNLVFSTERSVTYFRFLENTFTYGATYQVRVQVKQGNTYGSEGSSCSILLSKMPITSLVASQCNSTINTSSDIIYATAVAGVASYRFTIYDSNSTQVAQIERPNNYFKLNDFAYVAGVTYSVAVATKQEGQAYGLNGGLCTISTPAPAVRVTAVGEDHKVDASDVEVLTFKLYPNPFQTGFVIVPIASDLGAKVSYEVFDLTGKLIESNVLNVEVVQNYTIGEEYARGMYIVHVKQGTTSQTFKMIKQ